MNAIDQALMNAYLRADYRAARGFILKIGEESQALSDWYVATGTATGLFITAFNPASVIRTAAENAVDHELLGLQLRRIASVVEEATGSDPLREWPDEAGYIALGLSRRDAAALGHRFGQNAVVWAGADAVPQLIICAP